MAFGQPSDASAQDLDTLLQNIPRGSRLLAKHNIGFTFSETFQDGFQQSPPSNLRIMDLHDPHLALYALRIDVLPEGLRLPINNPYRYRLRPRAVPRHDMQLIDRVIGCRSAG